MKTTELRQGNLVYKTRPDGKEIIEVETIYKHFINGLGISAFEPIPLTEEWLIRFGFVKQRSFQNSYCKQLKSKLWFTIYETGEYEDPNELTFKEPKKWYISEGKFDIKIKFLHHFQNYFYFTTGEELTLKNEGL